MHEVPADADHEGGVYSGCEHRGQQHRRHRSTAPRPGAAHARRPPADYQEQRDPQRVRGGKILRVAPALGPVGGASFLCEGGVRHQGGEVAHPKDLIDRWHEDRRQQQPGSAKDPCLTALSGDVIDQECRQKGAAKDRQIRPDQRTQPEHEGGTGPGPPFSGAYAPRL